MNGLLAPSSPARRPRNRGGGGGTDGSRSSRGNAAGGRPRGRARGGGSRLASSKPINQTDLSPSAPASIPNGESGFTDTDFDSADDSDVSREDRFNKTAPGNRYEQVLPPTLFPRNRKHELTFQQLKITREAERKEAIRKGLIDDPDKPRTLSEAIRFIGTCPDMCPEFEMHQREYQNNVEKREIDPQTGRIDKSRAVKAFHRPAAGNDQPLPSDVRPPPVLVKTLDYLFSNILEGADDIYATHAFIRDRTRSIRQDFTVQNHRGREAIECHERIARYHILCLHALCDNPNFSEQQEMEQLRKVLQSLMEFYKDTSMSTSPLALPNETEFRAYYALVFLRDHDVSRQLQTLSEDIFFSPPMIRSLRLRSLAQRSNDKFVQNNAEAAPNSFVRFFKEVQRSTTFLESCILETWFGSIRTGALKALRQALGVKALQVSQVPVPILVRMLGFDDTEQFVAFCIYLDLDIIEDEAGEPKSIWFKRSVPWEEPASYLHQFSRDIVEAKRRSQSNQSVVNGMLARQLPANGRAFPTTSYNTSGLEQQASLPFSSSKPPPMANGAPQPQLQRQLAPFSFKPTAQPPKPLQKSETAFAPKQPSTERDFDSKPPLKAPTPQRAKISPVLSFQSPAPVSDGPGGQTINSSRSFAIPTSNLQPQFQSPEPFTFPKTPSISIPIRGADETTHNETPVPRIQPLPPLEDTRSSELERTARRQSQFERQEKLLQAELTRQERERKSKLELEEQERQKSLAATRQTALERQQLRQKESALLRSQKMATKEREEQERMANERRKAAREKNIEFYTEEIVNTIVQEHILEVSADVLASGFNRQRLLTRALRHLKKICTRSLRRKQQQLEQISQSRIRKGLLVRALGELDRGAPANSNKKPRRQSHRLHRENEEALEEVLLKASEESKELWRPMDLQRTMSPYVDGALSKGGLLHVEWNLLILSAENQITEETRWLRTKLGFIDETESRVPIPSDVAEANIIWSSVMQFSGSLDNVGALIFIYEGFSRSTDPAIPHAQPLLHEVVRQTSLQSRYKCPVLVINFNDFVTNASEVARELDLQGLSQRTTSVPAFQVLTIGAFGEANLETSMRSFLRHISAAPNENRVDPELEKKRKRESARVSTNGASHLSLPQGGVGEDSSPSKKLRNMDGHQEHAVMSNVLPKAIESLYASILSAEKELEEGRRWDGDEWNDM